MSKFSTNKRRFDLFQRFRFRPKHDKYPPTWDDVFLSNEKRAVLDAMVELSRGAALFSGRIGTGRSIAAEVIAEQLGRDLYRVDLSAIGSRYIGETEKHLERVFDAADAAGAVLLFDEAEALLGKRTDVKDSSDRYAHIDVGYLLDRLESHQGLVIFAAHAKSNIDPAFLRRLRYVVEFP